VIKRLPDGRWLADVEPVKGSRYRKRFTTKADAVLFEAQKRAEHSDGNKRPKQDKRTLSQLADRWYQLHGHTLTDGQRRREIVKLHAQELGDPVASQLTAKAYLLTRGQLLSDGTSGKTLNNRLGYLKAVFNSLIAFDDIAIKNPLSNVKPLRLQESPVTFLSSDQIGALLTAVTATRSPDDLACVVRVCLSTGARWSEALNLTKDRIKGGAVEFVNTKSKRVRVVPVSLDLEKRLRLHLDNHGYFSNCIRGFHHALNAAEIDLPKGQATHVLRHTFAAHFVMNGGNILVLQKILGHSTINMTMRYAHLAPDHLREAVTFNPLRQLFDTTNKNSP